MTTEQSFARIGGVSAVVGAVAVMVGTLLHPMRADPADYEAAFLEYAQDPLWVASHLTQFVGVAFIGVGLLALASLMTPGRAAAWGRVGALGAGASVALAAVLQAVDGVALKVMVVRWSQASDAARASAFDAAVAVRQIEVGLASLLSLVFGLTMIAYSLAMVLGKQFPKSLAVLGAVAGIGTLSAGLVAAHDGFSAVNMMLTTGSGPLSAVWTFGVGVCLWRQAARWPRPEE